MKNIFSLFALLAFPAFSWPQTPAANLSVFTGNCYIWHQGQTAEAEIGQPLFSGDSVRTGKDSKAEVSFDDGTSVRISDNARLLVQQADTVRSLKLLWGKLWAKVAKLSSSRQCFQVETPTAVAGVRGTVFRVEVDADTVTRVAVEEGEVDVVQPRLESRMIRLAALYQTFARRDRNLAEPSAFDPAREARWERWTKKSFLHLSKTLGGILSALEKRLKQQEELLRLLSGLQSSRKVRETAEASKAEALRRRALENQRQWRQMQRMGERKLRQLILLSRRVEDEEELTPLQEQAESAQSRLEELSERYQQVESQIMNSLEDLEREDDSIPQGGGGSSGYERMANLLAFSRTFKAKVDALALEIAAIAGRLADFARDLSQVRRLLAEHPIIARQRFFSLRNDYFAFKQQHQGFLYHDLESAAAALRSASLESSQIANKYGQSDPVYGEISQMRAEIEMISENHQKTIAKIRQARLAGKAIERQLLDISGLIR